MINSRSLCRTAISISLMGSVSACSLINPHIGVDMEERNEIASAMDACSMSHAQMAGAMAIVAEQTNRVLELTPAAADARYRANVANGTDKTDLEAEAVAAETDLMAARAAQSAALKNQAELVKPISPYCQFHGALPGAIEYANTLREDYYDAVGDQSKLKNGLALALIPMSAAALYLGISGGSSDAILGLAAAGAAGLGLGSFFSSEPRQKAYLAGSTSLGCAITRSAPYLMKEPDYANLTSNVGGLADLRGTLTTNVANAISWVKTHPGDPAVADAQAAIDDAQNALTDAGTVAGKGTAAISKVDNAGLGLYAVVDDIRDKVSVEVLKTEPDISAITAIANGLNPSAKSLIGAWAPPAKPAAPGGGVGVVGAMGTADELTETLRSGTAALRSVIYRISPVVDRMTDLENQLGAVTGCPFQTLQDAGFKIDPTDTTKTIKVGETYVIQVTSAIGNATAQIIGGGDQAGLESKTEGSGSGLRITLTAKKAGVYTVSISDASGKNSKTLTLTVEAAGAKMTVAPATVPPFAKNTSVDIVVKGVDSIIFPTFTGGDKDGLDFVVAPAASQQKVTIKGIKPGDYTVTIKDGTKQQSVDVAVKVTN